MITVRVCNSFFFFFAQHKGVVGGVGVGEKQEFCPVGTGSQDKGTPGAKEADLEVGRQLELLPRSRVAFSG